MAIYKPSLLIEFLNQIGINPKKSLSQNFLIDGNIVRKIIKEADISSGDLVIEIGAGPGSLTEALLEAKADVIAIEKDHTLAKALERFLPSYDKLQIICQDVLEVPLEMLFKQDRKVKIIGNLPYHITTPILTKFAPFYNSITSLTFMVQHEVAKRLVAKPGTKEFSSLTLFLSFYAQISYAFKVGRNCFYPIPGVDSAIINLRLKEPPSGIDQEKFFQMTRKAFEMRRKTLINNLRDLYPLEKLEHALERQRLSLLVRPEALSLDQFLELFKTLECQ